MSYRNRSFWALLALAFLGHPALAQQATAPTLDPSTTAVLKLDGLEIELDADGNWVRMYSTYRQPVTFPDRSGIRKAYTMAEEKGKANMVRYFDQHVQSERLVAEVDSATHDASRIIDNGKESFTKNSQRRIVESVKEFTRSYSQGTLRGLTVVEQGYDEKAEEVWVKVGLSKKTIGLANQIKQDMTNPATGRAGAAVGDSTKKTMTQPSEVQKRKIP